MAACPEGGSAQNSCFSSPLVSTQPMSQMEVWNLNPSSQVTEVASGHHARQPDLELSREVVELSGPPLAMTSSGAPPHRPRLKQEGRQLRPPGGSRASFLMRFLFASPF